MKRNGLILVVFACLAGCGGAREGSRITVAPGNLPDDEGADAGAPDEVDGGEVSVEPGPESVESTMDEGVALTMDVIDVGTGLSILVRGPDFALLYDAGSKEDIGSKKGNRVLAFLKERHPDLKRLDHVVLSHPHRDHVNLMPEVIESYEVDNIWDVGLLHEVCPYRLFLRAVSEEKTTSYRSGARGPGPLNLGFDETRCRGEVLLAEEYLVVHGPRFEAGQKIRLGAAATLTFLNVDSKDYGDPNRNSMVARLDVAGKRILLMADAKGGDRAHPSRKPDLDSIEGRLVRNSPKKIRADVMVVGHHGSHTSSRTAFLDAVGARAFIVSVGKANFHGYKLPNMNVIHALEKRGQVFRTDARDSWCPTSKRKVGKKNDGMVGGCDNIRVVVYEEEERDVEFEVYPEKL